MTRKIDDALLAIAIERSKKGESLVEISKDLNVKGNSISQALHRRGIKLGRKTSISSTQLEKAKVLYQSGKSQQEVADTLGVNRSTLSAKFKLIKFDCRPRLQVFASKRLDIETVKKAHEVYLQTRKSASIAESLGIHKVSLINNFHHYNFEVKLWKKYNKSFIEKINNKIVQGFSLAELGEAHEFSPSGFRQAAKRIGINVNKTVFIEINPQILENAKVLLGEGKSFKEIALLLEQPEASIKRELQSQDRIKKRKNYTYSHNRPLIGQKKIDKVVRLYWDAKSIKEIANLIHVSRQEVIDALASKEIHVHQTANITDVQIKLIYERRINERVGISTLCKEYEVGAATIYERFKKLGLEIDRSMGNTRATFTESQIRSIYEEAHQRDISIAQVVKNRGLDEKDYIVTSVGRSLGLKPPSPDSMKGHQGRKVYLYILRVISGSGIVGIYAGSSVSPKKRAREHLVGGQKNDGVNLKEQFIYEAHSSATQKGLVLNDWFSLEVLDATYPSSEIAEKEVELINKTQVECANNPNKQFLNTLIGAPSGGYGRKFSAQEEEDILNLYTSGIISEKIAVKLKVGRSTINRIVQKAGAKRSPHEYLKKFSDADRAKAYALYKEGHVQVKIAQKLKMSTATLSKIIRTFKANEKNKG